MLPSIKETPIKKCHLDFHCECECESESKLEYKTYRFYILEHIKFTTGWWWNILSVRRYRRTTFLPRFCFLQLVIKSSQTFPTLIPLSFKIRGIQSDMRRNWFSFNFVNDGCRRTSQINARRFKRIGIFVKQLEFAKQNNIKYSTLYKILQLTINIDALGS